jgi:hypothetical protein
MLIVLLAFGSFAPTASAMRTPARPPVPAAAMGVVAIQVFEIGPVTPKPLPGAVIALVNGSGDTAGKGISDVTGTFVATLPEGSYKILASMNGYSPGYGFAEVKANSDSQVSIDLVKDPSITDSVKVTIFVFDPRGDGIYPIPIANALVQVFDYQGMTVGKGLTDQNGNYSLLLKGGKFGVKVHADGYTDSGCPITLKGDERTVIVPVALIP